MDRKEIIVKLERPARKAGGDRYKEEGRGEAAMIIYIPQYISRRKDTGIPHGRLKVSFEPLN